MHDPRNTGDLQEDVGRRLSHARQAFGLDRQQFGVRAGLSQPQYHQFEKGKRLLTLRAAMKLCDEYSLTLDWIYRGDPSGLPYRMWDKTRAVAEADTGSR